MTGQLMTRLGYSPDASRSEQVRWLVSRCEPLLLVMLSAHYLLRTSRLASVDSRGDRRDRRLARLVCSAWCIPPTPGSACCGRPSRRCC